MHLKLAALGSFVLALPVAIEAPQDSTRHHRDLTGTYAQISGGAAYYALIARGCNGEELDRVPVHARDVGAEIEHAFRGPFRLGARGGWLHDEIGEPHVVRDNRYVNPYVTLEKHPVSAGIGWMVAERDFIVSGDAVRLERITFSAHLRVGDPSTQAFSISWMENVPLYSGGGYLDVGMASHPDRHIDLYTGLSTLPYDGAGFSLKADWRFTPAASLNLRTRLGYAGHQFQNGVAVGLGYRLGTP